MTAPITPADLAAALSTNAEDERIVDDLKARAAEGLRETPLRRRDDAITAEDLRKVDEAARVLARVARQLGLFSIDLTAVRGGGAGISGYDDQGMRQWEEVGENGELPSAALARRLVMEAVALDSVDYAVLVDVSANRPQWQSMVSDADWMPAFKRLLARGLVKSLHKAIGAALTPAGRAYLAAAAGGAREETP